MSRGAFDYMGLNVPGFERSEPPAARRRVYNQRNSYLVLVLSEAVLILVLATRENEATRCSRLGGTPKAQRWTWKIKSRLDVVDDLTRESATPFEDSGRATRSMTQGMPTCLGSSEATPQANREYRSTEYEYRRAEYEYEFVGVEFEALTKP
ncbi:MAG: hypothetical protein KDA71_23220 [Planctomycetales bacterium]|nr:hypothetical protein [Planctomycetales bacterium]